MLDNNRGKATLTTSHDILLTGLEAGQTYYFTVLSTDIAANTAIGGELSFDTTAACKPPQVTCSLDCANPRRSGCRTGRLRARFAATSSCQPSGVVPQAQLRCGDLIIDVAEDEVVRFRPRWRGRRPRQRGRCRVRYRRRSTVIRGPSLTLEVHATDSAGNTATCSASPGTSSP